MNQPPIRIQLRLLFETVSKTNFTNPKRGRGTDVAKFSAPRRGFGWVLNPLLIALVAISGCRRESQRPADTFAPGKTVEIQIDFNGHGQNKQFHMDWSPGLTALGCLERLQADGKISLASKGAGDQTLLTAIDGLENLWAAGDNWIYLVNESLGDRSSAVFDLKPGDRVLWRFGKYAPK